MSFDHAWVLPALLAPLGWAAWEWRGSARRLALGLTAGAAILATGLTALSTRVAGWVPGTFAAIAGVLTLGLVVDLLRRSR